MTINLKKEVQQWVETGCCFKAKQWNGQRFLRWWLSQSISNVARETPISILALIHGPIYEPKSSHPQKTEYIILLHCPLLQYITIHSPLHITHGRKTKKIRLSLVHNWSSQYSKIKLILWITVKCRLYYYAYWMDWLPYATLQTFYPWVWERMLRPGRSKSHFICLLTWKPISGSWMHSSRVEMKWVVVK